MDVSSQSGSVEPGTRSFRSMTLAPRLTGSLLNIGLLARILARSRGW
ncbi:MAG: hypothetical protein AAF500_07395 [Myxococcota bacterium]